MQPPLQPLLNRLEHLTFAWFTSSMSLGGIANLLLSRIIPSTPLYYLGLALFSLNLPYLSLLIILQVLRFTLTPASFGYTLSHPIECCFLPTPLLALATVINAVAIISKGAGAWEVVLRIAFWIYVISGVAISLLCYASLMSRAEQNLHHMNPAWVLPIFPLMLTGSVAAAVVPTQSEQSGLAMSITGLTCQGLGLCVSCMMYAILLLRLMTVGLPPPKVRPGLFMCCGPPAFTIICFLSLSSSAQRILPTTLPLLPSSAIETLSIISLTASVLLWGVSAWFFLLTLTTIARSIVVKEEREQVEFTLAWWASVFPITGWASATNEIGKALGSGVIKGVARGMVVYLMVVGLGVAVGMVKAVWRGGIMVEGKDEDRVIDTMYRRCGVGDEEKGEGVRSEPPTYPSTPTGSIRRLESRGRHSHGEGGEEKEPPLPSSSSSGSSCQAV